MFDRKNFIFVLFGVFMWGLIESEGTDKGKDEAKNKAFLKTIVKLPYTFRALDRDNKTIVEYEIKRVPKLLYYEAGQFSIKYCVCEDPLYISLGIPEDKNALNRFSQSLSDTYKYSVLCIKKGSNEIIGLNRLEIMHPKQKYSPKNDLRFQVACQVYESFGDNIFKKYGVSKYLTSDGLSVHPDYRRRGIAQYLLLAMDVVCREKKIQLTASEFVSTGAAAAAKKVGYRYEDGICYAKLAAKFPLINLTNIRDIAIVQLSKGQFYKKNYFQAYDYFNPNVRYDTQSDEDAKKYFDNL